VQNILMVGWEAHPTLELHTFGFIDNIKKLFAGFGIFFKESS